jgi:AcrR family transcriptional regulator
MANRIQGKVARDAIIVTSLEVFYRGIRRTEITQVTEGARVSDSGLYESPESIEALIRAFLGDRHAIWLRWFQSEIDARYETTGGGLEIIADVLRATFEGSPVHGSPFNKVIVSNHHLNGRTLEIVRNQKIQMRRFVEQLAVKMGLRYPDIAASAAVQIIERTIVAILTTGDLSELKTAQLLFQCLQNAHQVDSTKHS